LFNKLLYQYSVVYSIALSIEHYNFDFNENLKLTDSFFVVPASIQQNHKLPIAIVFFSVLVTLE